MQRFRFVFLSVVITCWMAGGVFAGTSPDAGLNMTFQLPAGVTGTTIDATDIGEADVDIAATPNNNADDDAVALNDTFGNASSGDEIFLPNGIYHIQSEINLPTGVSLRGESEAGTIIRAGFSVTGEKTLRVNSGRSDIIISNLTFDSDGSEAPRYAIEVGAQTGSLTERIHILDVTIDTFRERGIVARTTRHVKVEDCSILNATALGGGGQGYGVTIQGEAGHTFESSNNWVTDCTIGPVIRHGVLLQYETHHNLIENNTLTQNTEDAIDLHGEDEYSNEVRFNIISDGDRSGIGVGNTGSTHDKSGPNNWIHNNTITNCLDGIEIIEGTDDVYVEDNLIQQCDNYGIRIDNFDVSGDPLEDICLSGNRIDDCGRGIFVDVEAPGLIVFNNCVKNNSTVGIETDSAVTAYNITFNDFSCNGSATNLGSSPNGTTRVYSDNMESNPCGACAVPVEASAFVLE